MSFHPNSRNGAPPHWLIYAGVLCLVLTFCACPQEDIPPDPAPGEDLQGTTLKDPTKSGLVVLEVGDSAYTNADFLRYLEMTAGDEFVSLTPEALSRLFDDFVDEMILLAGARIAGFELSEEEKHDYLDRLQRDLPDFQSDAVTSASIRMKPEQFVSMD